MDVGQVVYWAATTGIHWPGTYGDGGYVEETGHDVQEGQIMSVGGDTVAIWPDRRKPSPVFLPMAAVFADQEAAVEDAARRNVAMFGDRDGKWEAKRHGTLKEIDEGPLVQDLRIA